MLIRREVIITFSFKLSGMKRWQQREKNTRDKYTTVFGTKENELGTPLDLRVIVLDCVSRDFFHRHFVHTREYLKELNQTEGINVIEFEQYQVLALNTLPNMYQFATAKTLDEIKSTSKVESIVEERLGNRLDGGSMTIPLLWDYLHSMGYISSVGEDVGRKSRAATQIYGYRRPKPTYHVDPIFPATFQYVYDTLKNSFIYNSQKCPCVGDKFVSDLAFQFSRSFIEKYHDIPKFFILSLRLGLLFRNEAKLLSLSKINKIGCRYLLNSLIHIVEYGLLP